MSKLDEIKKRAYGTSEEDKNEEKKKGSQSVLNRIKAKVDGTYDGGIDINAVKSWFTNSGSTLKDIGEYYKANEGKWVSDYGSNFTDSIANLKSNADSVGWYLRSHKNDFDNYDELYKGYLDNRTYLTDYEKEIASIREQYSQFKSEDEFNKWYEDSKASQEEYNKRMEYNAEEGQAFIDQLQGDLNGIKNTKQRITELENENKILEQSKYKGNRDAARQIEENNKKIAICQSALDDAYAKYGGSKDKGKTFQEWFFGEPEGIEQAQGNLEALLSSKMQFHTQATRTQKAAELASVANPESENYDAEFSKYSGYVDSSADSKMDMDAIYEYINGDEATRSKLEYNLGSYMLEFIEKGYGQLKKEEIAVYNYYYSKYGKDKAQEYLDSIEETLTYRQGKSIYSNLLEDNTFAEYLFGIAAGLDQFSSGIEGIFADGYTPASSIQVASGLAREDLADNGWKWYDFKEGEWSNEILGNSTGQMFYDSITTTSNMLPSILTSTVIGMANPTAGAWAGSALLGASAGGNAKVEMLNLGYSQAQANAYGIMVGASEAVLEKVLGGINPLGGDGIFSGLAGKLTTSAIDKIDKALGRAALTVGAKLTGGALDEALEEGLQTIIEPWFKEIVTKVDWEDPSVEEVLYSSLLGAISSLGFNAGNIATNAAINKYNKNQATMAHGEAILDNGGVDPLKELALEMTGANADKKLTKAVGKVEKDASAKNVGKLSTQLKSSISKQNRADIETALTEKGLSAKDAKRVAEYLVGKNELTTKQKAEIEGNEKIKAVVDELINSPDSKIAERDSKLLLARMGMSSKADTLTKATKSGEMSVNVDVDVKDKVSESGKTTRISTGEAVTIDKKNPIAKTKTVDGERIVYLNTDKGMVESTDVEYGSESEGLLYEAFIDMNPAFANAVIRNYDGSVPIMDYIHGMREGIILYGRHNFQGIGKDIAKNTYFATLSETDQAFSLKLGRAYAKTEAKKADANLHKAIQNATERAKAEGVTPKNVKGGKVSFEKGTKAETKEQKRAVRLAKYLAQAIGIDIVFYDSTTAPKGSEEATSNGYYDEDTDTIHLDLQKGGDDTKTIAFTLSHELVHFIKKWSPTKFNTFASFLMEQYGDKAADMLSRKMVALNTNDPDLAYEEMVCDACETMLLDSNAMVKLMQLRQTDLDLFEKIKMHILELLNNLREMYRSLGYEHTTEEAKALLAMTDVLDKFYAMFEDAAVDATKNYQALGTEGYNELVAKSTKNANETVFGEASVDVGKTESGVKHQLKAHKTIGENAIAYNERHKAVHKAILQVGVESMYEMAETMLPYLEEEGILPPDIPGKTIFKNGSYGRTGENTTLCVRTLTYEDFKDRVAEKVGRPLTVSESLLVSQKIYDIATEPQCIYCYVAADRKAYDEYLGEYWKAMDKYIKALRKGGDSEALYNEYLAGRKDTNQQKKRWSQWEAIANSGKEYISAKDLTTKRKRDRIIASKNAFSEQIKDAQRYAQSASWAKTVFDYRAYKGEILKMTSKFVDMLNSEYGLRMYSFSDYTPAFIVENMQMLIDASVKGLKSLAYTKDTDYVEIFASTGQAINVSCFAKWDAESGTYVEDNRQGANWEKTKNLRKQYRNVGAVMVATNDAMVEWALKQDWVDIVIPYHIVKTGTTIANEYQWNNYTSESSDKVGNKAANIYPTEHNNDFATYSNLLTERGITPRFSRWYDKVASGELTEDQYMKLVNEVRLPASELTPVVPSFNLEAAKKSFGIDENGEVIEGGFVDKGGYMGGWYRQGVDVNQEVMAVSEDIKAGKSSLDVDYGMSKAGKERVEARYKKQAKKQDISEDGLSYNSLVALPNIVGTTLDSSTQVKLTADGKIDEEWLFERLFAQCKSVKTNAPLPTYYLYSEALGTNVEILKKSIRHGYIASMTQNKPASTKEIENVRAALNLHDILKTAIVVNLSEKHKTYDSPFAYVMIGVTRMDDTQGGDGYYAVRLVVQDRKKGGAVLQEANVLGLLNAVNAKKIDLPNPQVGSERTVALLSGGQFEYSIAHLLNDVKSVFPDTFSKDVYNHFNMQRKENKTLSPLKFQKKTTSDKDYLDVVNRGDMETAQRMVDEAAKEWGAITNGNAKVPRPLHLYHGTGTFGFTRFRDGRIYATAAESVAAGYNRGRGLGRVRSSSLKYIPNDGTVETAIKNAKNVLGAKLTKLDDVAKQNIITKADNILKDVANKVSELDEVTDYKKAEEFFEYLTEKYGEDKTIQWTNQLDNLHYMLASEYTAEEIVEDGEWLAHDLKRYHEWKQSLSELWSEEQEAIKDATLDKVFRYLLGYEYGDALIDIEYGLGRLMDDKQKVVNHNGNLIYLDDVIDGIEMAKDTGIYDLYGHPGEKPLIIDEGKRFWDAIPFENGFRSTDYIVNWAKENGYTSVLFKTVLDPSSGGSANIYADEWVFFNPDQVKSADPVTYDDNGNVIPLSERFNKENKDIRYQKKQPSNRSLLANALDSVAQNDIEKNKLAQYKEKISLIEAEQEKLSEIRAKIKELSFPEKGTRRDTEAIKKLQFEANQTANRINTYDRQLLNLEATTALKGVLQREKEMARRKEAQKGKEVLANYREKAAKTQQELLTRYQESRKKGIEGRRKTEMRHKIKDVVNELNQYLTKGTKEKHVPIELQKAVAEALDAVNMDTVGAEERIAKLQVELRNAKSLEDMKAITKKIERIQEMGGNLEAKLSRLKTAYDSIINSDDPLIANSHDDVISNSITKVIEVVGDTPLRDMSLYQLEAVYDLYKMVLATIRNTNKAFKAAKGAEISTIANGVIAELMDKKRKTPYSTKAMQAMSEFDWNNLKPVYAFERIGSANFTKVFNEVRAGEDVWANDMSEAQAFREEQFKQYKYDSWDFKKRYGFTSTSGMHFELSLDQIMSLYAFSKRDQAGDHLKYGGFVFDGLTEVKTKNKLGVTVTYQLKDATAYNLSEETLAEIISKLTPEQKAFADAMQDYLSTVMGEKGNEVSLALYDIKLFKEKHYFPLKSAPQYLAKAKEQAQGEVKIKNSGFTKETTPKAKNPIVLSSFMDVWAGHVNEMSMYHAFTLPLEDFYRVYNYHTPADEKMEMVSVGASLENAHGQAAVEYIDQLLKDLNGGARSDPRENPAKALMSKFKKASVMASMSVVVQQPTAIVRAMALVDAKYFAGKKATKGKHKEVWEEVKKYAPIAVIKEMGYFDTGMGKGSVEWLKGEKTFMEKVDDVTSKLPALADEVTWVAIWDAVKRETVHTHKDLRPNSEEFLKAVGERFTEVIVKTQVYDSTLSRSANMRSKGGFMQMWTAFMAEPTTSINMLQDAFRKGNKKYIARTLGAVYGSVLLNSALVSLVYAMRDDDDDETFLEKYLSRFTTEMIDGINPITYIPFFKDIWSLAQGFDVERADMSLINNLIDSLQQMVKVFSKDTSDMDEDELAEHKKAVTEAILSITDNISSLVGVPVKNVRRDLKGIINAIETIKEDVNGRKTTAGSLGDVIGEDVKDSVPVWGWFPDESKGDKLYDAIIKGDTAYIDRLKEGYKSEDAYHSAIRKALRENDPRIKEAATAVVNGEYETYSDILNEIADERHFTQKDIKSAIDSEVSKMTPKEETEPTKSKEESIYEIGYVVNDYLDGDTHNASKMREDIINTEVANGKDREEAEKSFNSSFRSYVGKMYKDGEISRSTASNMLVKYGGYDSEEAENETYWKLKEWDFRIANGEDASYSKYTDFYDAVKTGKNIKAVINEYTSHGVETKTLASQITSYYKPIYREMTNAERANLKGYLLNAYALLGYNRADKDKDINKWLED